MTHEYRKVNSLLLTEFVLTGLIQQQLAALAVTIANVRALLLSFLPVSVFQLVF
jgi:hypothetical protein